MGLENSFKRAYDELITSFIELENDLLTNFNDDLLLDLYFEQLKKVVNYESIVYLKYNEITEAYTVIKESGYDKELKKKRLKTVTDGIIKWAGKMGRPFVLGGDNDIKTHVILPVLIKETLVGAFILDTRFDEDYFDQNKTRILQIISNRISIAFENRELYKNLEKRNHKLRALKNYLDSVISNMTDGIIVVDEKNKIVVFNKEMEAVLGIRSKKLIGKVFLESPLNKEFKEEIYNLINRAKNTKALFGEIDYPHGSGELIPFAYHIKKIAHDIEFTGTLLVLRNLRETKELLELKRIDKLKDEFVSMVSHELRTPLTSIKAYTETLIDMQEDGSVEKEFLSIINEESDRLNRLINDILDLSKIEAGKMDFNFESNDINEVVEKAVKNMVSFAETKNIKLTHSLNYKIDKILFDKDRILQVLLNLINNSIKFSFSGDNIIVRTEEVDKDYIKVEIEDHGVGIEKEHLEVVFEKFKQVENILTREVGGTGLGLPICKRIIEEHYGKIWVESEKNVYTKFIFLLPLV